MLWISIEFQNYFKLFDRCLLLRIRIDSYNVTKPCHLFRTIPIYHFTFVKCHQITGNIIGNKNEEPTRSKEKGEKWHFNGKHATAADKLQWPCRCISKRCLPVEWKPYWKWKYDKLIHRCSFTSLMACVVLTPLKIPNKMILDPARKCNNWQRWTVGWRLSSNAVSWRGQNKTVYKAVRFSHSIFHMRSLNVRLCWTKEFLLKTLRKEMRIPGALTFCNESFTIFNESCIIFHLH